MNIHSLNELNRMCSELKKDADQVIDQVTQILNSMTWLVHFAREVEPKIENLDKIAVYAEVIPGLQSVVDDLRNENQLLRNRQENTAIVHGLVLSVNSKANPPVVKIGHAESEFELYVPHSLFGQVDLEVGMVIVAEADLMTHKPPQRRDRIVVFYATKIEVINSSIDSLKNRR